MDTGNFAVNVDDAILSGKVSFQGKDYVLLLLPGMLVCREFATNSKGFSLKLDQITGCYVSRKSLNLFEISAVIPKSTNDPALVQSIFEIQCHAQEEVEEWVETLQSVITDRNIRAIDEKEKENQRQRETEQGAMNELKSMFPNLEEDVLFAVYVSTKNNLPQAIEELLEFNDPEYKANRTAALSQSNPSNITSTPQSQLELDEQLALMLQDELFLEQLQKDEQFRHNLSGEHSGESSIGSKLQEMSDATKKKFAELYHKFKKSGDKSNAFANGDPLGEEMHILSKQQAQKKDTNGYEYDEQEESEGEGEIPLERPLTSRLFNTNSYQPLATSSPPRSPLITEDTEKSRSKDIQSSLLTNEEL